MNMSLVNMIYSKEGVFGEVHNDKDQSIAVSLQHAYQQDDGKWLQKLLPGTYTCKRGMHQLEDKPVFETFEITGVEGHTGILFHKGNYNKDSSGCVLLGMSMGDKMILNSAVAFDNFMRLQKGVDSFELIVKV